MKESKPHKRSLNGTFNDLARITTDTGFLPDGNPHDPDVHLSFEQRQTKEDLLKIAYHNPEEVLAGRIAPLNIGAKKFSTLLRKQKEHVDRLLLHMQLEQIRTYFAELQTKIQEMLDHLREMRLALLKAIKSNDDLLDLVNDAREGEHFGRADDGAFINEALHHMVETYMEDHNIPPEKMKDFTLEQTLAMVEEQSEHVTMMNMHMSDQIGVIDGVEKDLIKLSKRVTAKQKILDSDASEDIKKQAASDFYDEIDLEEMVSIVGNIEAAMNADHSRIKTDANILKEIDNQNMERVNNAAQRLTADPLMSGL